MTLLAEFPGPVLRAVPSFRFEIPEGFVLEEAPGSLAVLRATEETAGFTANLLVNHDRIVASATLRDAAVITRIQLTKAFAQVEVTDERIAEFPGRPTYLRAAKLRPADSDLVLHQVHAICRAPAPDRPVQTRDLFHLVGTCNALPEEDAERRGRAFIDVIRTFTFID